MSVRLAVFLAERFLRLPKDCSILVRRARSGRVNSFEALVADLAVRTGRTVQFYEPQGDDRGAVYRRDYAFVEAATYIEAYFAPDRVMEGGTGHIVDAALARECPVFAWTVTPSGIERVGEYEPSERPQRYASRPNS